jgi:acyl-CoA synthetase (NDP forming)
VSVGYTRGKDDVIKLLNLAVDAAGSLFEQLFTSEDDYDFPRIWQEVDFEGRKLFIQYSTVNEALENEADRLLGIKPEDIEKSYHILIARVHANVPTAKLEGVLAVEMAPKGGIELILGANKVPGLGTMVMVGLGGIYVEVFKDISFGYAPLSKEFSERMVETLRCFPVLQGTRGQAGYDIDALLDVIGRVSAFVTNHPEVKELDMNPVVIFPKGQGVKILDARILL